MLGRRVHAEKTDEVAAPAWADLIAQAALDEAPLRIAQGHGSLPLGAVGAYRRDALDVAQGRREPALLQGESDARHEDAVEKSLQNRREAVMPDRRDEDERFGGEQAIDVRTRLDSIRGRIEITKVGLARHDRIEALRIKIAIVDLMPALTKRFDDTAVERPEKSGLDRMRIEKEDPHFWFFSSRRAFGPRYAETGLIR